MFIATKHEIHTSPNSTWFLVSRHVSTRHVWHVEHVALVVKSVSRHASNKCNIALSFNVTYSPSYWNIYLFLFHLMCRNRICVCSTRSSRRARHVDRVMSRHDELSGIWTIDNIVMYCDVSQVGKHHNLLEQATFQEFLLRFSQFGIPARLQIKFCYLGTEEPNLIISRVYCPH